MIEYDHEPIRGLPGDLPEGERILWQGAPDWRVFARNALYTRWIAGYFAVLALAAAGTGSLFGLAATIASGAIGVGLLTIFARLVAKTTVYTLTNRRVVLRIGVALNKCINLPLAQIGSADLRPQANGHGDIALSLIGAHRLGYAMLWPHARPLRFGKPEPMLRAIPEAEKVAGMLARASAAIVPNAAPDSPRERPVGGLTGAAA
jgi:hypothetical protein